MSAVSHMIVQDFAYAHGRIGVLQDLLLTQSDVDRLLGSHSFAEAERFLTELTFTNVIPQSLARAEEIFRSLGQWIQQEIEQMTPEAKRPIFSILWFEGDAPLLSYLIKHKRHLTSSVSREPMSVITAYRPSALRALVENDAEESLPPQLIACVRSMLADTKLTPQQIDMRTAQCFADLALSLAAKSGSAAIATYVRHTTDLQNIRTALRTSDEPGVQRRASFLTGGTIPIEEFLGSRAHLAAAVNRVSLSYHLADVLGADTLDTNALERGLSEVLAADIAHMWNKTLSIEPIFAFAALVLSHMRMLRALFIGKNAGYAPQEIKRMLPPFIPASHYVLS